MKFLEALTINSVEAIRHVCFFAVSKIEPFKQEIALYQFPVWKLEDACPRKESGVARMSGKCHVWFCEWFMHQVHIPFPVSWEFLICVMHVLEIQKWSGGQTSNKYNCFFGYSRFGQCVFMRSPSLRSRWSRLTRNQTSHLSGSAVSF